MRVLLLAFLPLAACTRQLYDGPARPESEVARITSHSASAYRVYVREIDGKKAGFRWKQGRTLELLPGLHSVVIQVYYRTGLFGGSHPVDLGLSVAEAAVMPRGSILFEFPASPGGRYVFEARIRNGRVVVELEDDATGELVAGERLEGIWAAPWP